MGNPYDTAPKKRDPWKDERVKKDRSRSRNPSRAPKVQVVVITDRRGKVQAKRVRNPLDLMTALNAAGDIAMIKEFAGEKRAGAFTPKKRRKNPFGEGVCPPHLKKFRFRKT